LKKKQNLSETTLSVTLFKRNRTGSGVGSNLRRRDQKQATNRLRYGIVSVYSSEINETIILSYIQSATDINVLNLVRLFHFVRYFEVITQYLSLLYVIGHKYYERRRKAYTRKEELLVSQLYCPQV
jgi:hypothetical protein